MFLAEYNTPVLTMWLSMLPYLLGVVLLVLLRMFTPQIKGWFGERAVQQELERRLDSTCYTRFDDIMLPADGGTTQIDHIVLSRYGIFVIETKNYKGWIFGSINDAQWTRKFYRATNRFQNPLRQNERHVRVLLDLTGLPRDFIKSVVAFAGEARFQTAMPPNVVYLSELADHILSYTRPLLAADQLPVLAGKIKRAASRVTPEQRAQHVANLRKRHSGS